MPRRDGTGPMGYGPMTGWGMGPCRDYGYGYGRRGRRMGYGRRGYGMGYGYGRGFGPGYGYAPYDDRSDREILEEEKEILQERLDYISKQLESE
ncbi:MAG TPA: DUF5320 domain-containing protein [Bacillota bacterium]|jgi:hypothetical protein|nr:DUF5320 domain-containing protein [Fastidiosipila sp.]HPX93365.1 DUF5320 domain-containing protein [Bacillota bacterium]HQB80497.1 DUF5320 domain-containing protein [Bacillota bacterium]